MNKLKLEHIVGYLPYGLKVQCDCTYLGKEDYIIQELNSINIQHKRVEVIDWCEDGKNIDREEYKLSRIKPILKPMEMFNEEERQKYELWVNITYPRSIGTYSKEELSINIVMDNNFPDRRSHLAASGIFLLQYLYQNHYDIHGLIEQGLAVDVRTMR